MGLLVEVRRFLKSLAVIPANPDAKASGIDPPKWI
jgi:hypothetical protein